MKIKIKKYRWQEFLLFKNFDELLRGCSRNPIDFFFFFETSGSLFLLNVRKSDQKSASETQYF